MKQYVGKTEQELKQRHYGHRREIETKSSLLGKHFADSCGYTSFRIQVSGEFKNTYTVGAVHKCIESNSEFIYLDKIYETKLFTKIGTKSARE